MRRDRWARIDTLVESALLRPPEARDAYVEEACADDPALRDEVVSLVAHEAAAQGLLEPAHAWRHEPLEPGQHVGPYIVGEVIGTGGMGVVYRAVDTRLNRPVAIKAIGDSADTARHATTRLRAEALAAASLDHPFICSIYELLETATSTLIVMEFVEGEPLSAVLARGIPPLADTLRYASEIAEGLAEAHEHGFVHRDVKPANVMITPSGHVKLLDFGVARSSGLGRGATATHTALTGPGVVVGTPLYMSPEQALGRALTPHSDLFSLGVVLFECLTGQLPFEDATRDAYVQAMLAGRIRPLDELAPDAPDAVRRLVVRCLQPDPARRPVSAAIVAAELHRASLVPAVGPPIPRPGRRRWLAGILLTVAAGAAIPAYRLWRPPPADDMPAPELVPVVTEPGVKSDARISPDGQWLSFLSDREGSQKLFVERLDSGNAQPVQVPGEAVVSHAWSPDGKEFACVVRQKEGQVLEIVAAFFGGLPRLTIPLTPTPQWARVLHWVGNAVYLEVEPGAGGHRLWRVALDQPRIDDLTGRWRTALQFRDLDVSADGQTVVLAADDPGRNRQSDLWIASVDGSGLHPLTNDAAVERHPLWVGNTNRVAFESNRGGQLDLWELDIPSGRAVRLTSTPGEEVPSDATPDGSTVLFDQAEEQSSLWELEPGGLRARQLTADALSDFWPSVSADGRTLAFQRTRPILPEGYNFLDTRVFVTSLGPHAAAPQPVDVGYYARLSPDGTRVAYLRRPLNGGPQLLDVRNLRTGDTRTIVNAIGPDMPTAFPIDAAEQVVEWDASGTRLFYIAAQNDERQIVRAHLLQDAPPDVLAAGNVRDLRLSPDGGRLAYLEWPGAAFRVHVLDLKTGHDDVVHEEVGPEASVYLRGWVRGGQAVLFLRSRFNPNGRTYQIDVAEADLAGRARAVATADDAFIGTTRLNARGTHLYFTRSVSGVHNIYRLRLADESVRRITDNEQTGVSFFGIEPLADGRAIYSRGQLQRDIWKIQRPPK